MLGPVVGLSKTKGDGNIVEERKGSEDETTGGMHAPINSSTISFAQSLSLEPVDNHEAVLSWKDEVCVVCCD